MRVYISGGMTGFSRKEYTQRFNDAERRMKVYGYKVFNPVRWGWFLRFLPYKVCLAFDICMMCFCDRAYFLKGWIDSYGSVAEHQFAQSTGMVRMYEE